MAAAGAARVKETGGWQPPLTVARNIHGYRQGRNAGPCDRPAVRRIAAEKAGRTGADLCRRGGCLSVFPELFV